MREDMAKIIVERPRGGGSNKGTIRRWQRVPFEELNSREGMRRCWVRRKWLNENLAPLRRFLGSKVGQPWNDVNSEIREHINLNSAAQLHIWQHVTQYVCISVIEAGGKLLDERGRRLSHRFYVDPRTGNLCENTQHGWHRRQPDNKPKDYIRIGYWDQYRKLNGIWFHVQLKPLPACLDRVWDVVFKAHCNQITRERLCSYYGSYGYAFGKQQLSTKEISNIPGLATNKTLKRKR